jgi:hypothetical protein
MKKDHRRKPQSPAERQRARRRRLLDTAAVASPRLWLSACRRANDALALMLYVMRRHRVPAAALAGLIGELKTIERDAHRAMWGSELL